MDQQIATDTTQHPLTKTAVAVSAGNDKVCLPVFKDRLQRRSFVVARRRLEQSCDHTVRLESSHDVLDAVTAGLQICLGCDLNHIDVFRQFQQGKRITDGTARLARVLPTHHDLLKM